MMKLYWSPRTRSFSSLWLMEETGQPYERVLTDISTGAQKSRNILRSTRWARCRAQRRHCHAAEAAAICAYVAERYPRRSSRRRWATLAREISFTGCSFAGAASSPDGTARHQDRDEFCRGGLGDAQRVIDVLDTALQKGPWLLGRFSAADIVIGSRLNFAVRLFKMIPRGHRSTPISRAAWRWRSSAEKIAAGWRTRACQTTSGSTS